MPVAIYEVMGHHTDESFPRREAVVEAFNEGLSRYRQHDWTDAARHFRDALTANPNDCPSQIYAERCEIFRSIPPDPDWDGVWTVQSRY